MLAATPANPPLFPAGFTMPAFLRRLLAVVLEFLALLAALHVSTLAATVRRRDRNRWASAPSWRWGLASRDTVPATPTGTDFEGLCVKSQALGDGRKGALEMALERAILCVRAAGARLLLVVAAFAMHLA